MLSSRAQRGTFPAALTSLALRPRDDELMAHQRACAYFFAAFTGSLTFGIVANSTL